MRFVRRVLVASDSAAMLNSQGRQLQHLMNEPVVRRPSRLRIAHLRIDVDEQSIRRPRTMPALAMALHSICSEPFRKTC